MEVTKISSLLWLLLATLCASIQARAPNRQTMAETIPAYAITNYLHLLNSTKCRSEMTVFREAVDRRVLWSLRMLDASGKAPSGFVIGNNYWLGSRVECAFLSDKLVIPFYQKIKENNSLYRDPAEEQPPYKLHFFGANIRHNSTLQYHIEISHEDEIVLGLCLPASCTKNEVKTMLHPMLRNGTLLVGQLFSASFKLINVNDFEDDREWLSDGQNIVFIFILTLLCALIIIGTVLDLCERCSRKKDDFLGYSSDIYELENSIRASEKHEVHPKDIVTTKLKAKNPIKEYLLCFSFHSNIVQIFKVKKSSEKTLIFHGIKFFGMAWIILAHATLFGKPYFANRIQLYELVAMQPLMHIITNAPYSVDTFLFMGGFLLTYLFPKSYTMEKKQKSLKMKAKDLFLLIIKRYIRLTPTQFVLIMLMILNSTSQDKILLISMSEDDHTKCSKYWWRNMLYINNLFDFDELCFSWSWYLPNDFQFYIFGSFLIILSATHYKIAIGMGAASLIGSIVSCAAVAYDLDYKPTMSAQLETASDLYLRPWIRIGPYLIGMATAKLLEKWNYKLNLSKKMLTLCWVLTILCNSSIIFGTVNDNMSVTTAILYIALSRASWAVGIAWFVIACCTNNAGIVGKFLSLQIWVPLGKLTYGAYLLNPFLIGAIFRLSLNPIYVDTLTIGPIFLGFLVTTYICAVILAATTEIPFIRFLRIFIK